MKFVAHRGYPVKYPENTIPSFEAVLKHPECAKLITGIETDIRLTKDGKMALFHDDKINGTPVDQMTYVELQEAMKEKFHGVKVTNLDDFFACIGHKLELLVEMKDGGYDKNAFINSLDASLRHYNPKGDVILHSFSPILMQMAIERFKDNRGVRYGVLVCKATDLDNFTPELLAKIESIHPQWKGLQEDEEKFASYGKPFNVWTTNTKSEMDAMKALKHTAMVRAIMTDDLKLLESF